VKSRDILKKVNAKVMAPAFRFFGWDSLTRSKIHPRKDLVELGSAYGGWVVPADLLNPASICYCVGCGEDISFDLELIRRFNCDVYAFDPTPRAVAYVAEHAGENGKYRFAEVGLWDKPDTLRFYAPKDPRHVSHSLVNLQKTADYIEVQVDRLRNVMEETGHTRLDLLKIDIEGAEYKVIESLLEDNLDIKILCVEYDECFNPLDRDYKRRIRSSVNSLREGGYTLVCAQGSGNYTFVHEPETL